MSEDKYIHITSQELEERMMAIRDCWSQFFTKMVELYKKETGIDTLEVKYEVNTEALHEIVDRVYQREDYFKRYHSGMKMSEYKEIGLNMFWLAKFHPFNIDGKGFDERFCFDINEEFILYYMFIALEELAKIQKKNYDSERISRSLYDELLYSLSFRDISKEAMGIIVELVANIVMYE